jgi:hypothetical protein
LNDGHRLPIKGLHRVIPAKLVIESRLMFRRGYQVTYSLKLLLGDLPQLAGAKGS